MGGPEIFRKYIRLFRNIHWEPTACILIKNELNKYKVSTKLMFDFKVYIKKEKAHDYNNIYSLM